MKSSDPSPRSSSLLCNVDVVIAHDSWNRLDLDVEKYVKNIAVTAISAGLECVVSYIELCILLSCDTILNELNKNYRNKDQPTNVLSFPYSESLSPDINYHSTHSYHNNVQKRYYLGDIAISYERVLDESLTKNVSIKEYIAHMIIHGVLHLLDYDHKNDHDTDKMQKKEKEIMLSCGYSNPYEVNK